jgi:hypothetical protein
MMKKLISIMAFLALAISVRSQLTNNIAAYWKLDETSGSVLDASGTNTGTVYGATANQTGKINKAYSFNGTSSYVSIPNSTSLNIQGNAITLSAWIKSTTNTTQMIISKISGVGTHVSPYFQYNLQLEDPGSGVLFPRFYLSINGNPINTPTTSSINQNQWYLITGTYDGTTMRLYLNGAQITSQGVTGNITGYSTPVYLGINGAFGEPYSGSIDEVGIWSRALTAAEVTSLYNSGNGLPYSSFGGTVPTAPSGLTATVASCSQINLSWTDNSSNETGFKIYNSGGTLITTISTANTTTASVTGLSASTAYSYYVVAYNGAGNSSNSNTSSATTSACATVPTAPSGLTSTVASCTQVNLSWTDNSSNETGFNIYRNSTQIGSVSAGVTSYSNTGLTASTAYSYYVVAYNGAGNSSNSNTSSATTSACTTVPTAPSGLTATVASCSQVNLSWTDNSSNESGFKIYNSGGTLITTISTANTTTYSVTGLTASTTYSYYVVSYNGAGNSSNSNTASATTPACSSGSWQTNGSNIYYSSGKVSIGTTIANSASALTVNGKILATEVEVVSSIAADYVFEAEYELMPLTDLELYLKQNKHLPGIPSVAEFSKQGQNLGKMDDLLLRKIEELTLYVITQEQRMKKQDEVIGELKREITELKEK